MYRLVFIQDLGFCTLKTTHVSQNFQITLFYLTIFILITNLLLLGSFINLNLNVKL